MSLLQRTRVARALGDMVPPYSKFSSEETDGFHSEGRERMGQKKRREERKRKGGEKEERKQGGREGGREGRSELL